MNRRRLLARLLQGHVQNVDFNDLVHLAEGFGFRLMRISGSHQMFRHSRTRAKLNLQPDGRQAKPYQIRQLLRLVEKFDLKLEDEE